MVQPSNYLSGLNTLSQTGKTVAQNKVPLDELSLPNIIPTKKSENEKLTVDEMGNALDNLFAKDANKKLMVSDEKLHKLKSTILSSLGLNSTVPITILRDTSTQGAFSATSVGNEDRAFEIVLRDSKNNEIHYNLIFNKNLGILEYSIVGFGKDQSPKNITIEDLQKIYNVPASSN